MNEVKKISWMAQRYSSLKKNQTLQVGLAFIFGLMLVGAIIVKNYLFAVAILLSAVIYYQLKKKEGAYIPVEITEAGVSINNELTNFNAITAFWIDERDIETSLLLLQIKNTSPSVKVLVIEPEISTNEVKDCLAQFIKEDKIILSLIQELVNSL